MTLALFAEQLLNGVQFGTMLFIMSAGLTLVFGIMNLINLAHGSLYMLGAFMMATFLAQTGNFAFSAIGAIAATALVGAILELTILRRFYRRSHLDQVLVTFGLILVFNDLTRMIWGPIPIPISLPQALSGSVTLWEGLQYPTFRLFNLVMGAFVALGLYLLVAHTRAGMWVRAGASDRTMASALGVDVELVFVMIYASGAALAGFAGLMTGAITAVQVGMGEPVLVLALVVTVIGGIGSIRGAFVAALMIGVVDTFGRVLLPQAFGNMIIFMMMAAILAWRPQGLFDVHN
ncbi:branched-chain amino acid ABC transporter permease [Rhizobium sp. P28RR-XV]|uniref:branched-chain amino acid ABC transporter permease n=1 Tax=Rhizobium sp. P28RR-XV TaxID=2726737 RepID=UPI001456E27D|nr:branched-chain amino acid ABC transporter permease [Rhizobium sp. P28RR-XV]NLR88195.1 branched-chain amino acid ABC transporter permease [Rhizobium sp. P28RR-XV]